MSEIKKVGIFYNNSTLASIHASNFPIIIASPDFMCDLSEMKPFTYIIRKYFEFSVPENTICVIFFILKKLKLFSLKFPDSYMNLPK